MPLKARQRRHIRLRKKVTGTPARPRLCIFRSLKHIYAQLIDDKAGHTVASASTLDPEIKATAQGLPKMEKAKLVGALIAKRALAQGLGQVVFDRGGYKYHGRAKHLADAARETGLEF